MNFALNPYNYTNYSEFYDFNPKTASCSLYPKLDIKIKIFVISDLNIKKKYCIQFSCMLHKPIFTKTFHYKGTI